MERQIGPIEAIRPDHVNRYRFAAEHIPKKEGLKRVLDLACGCGYGSKILQDAGYEVTGVDCELSAIEYAEKHYPGPNYRLGRLQHYPFGGFDFAVSFETIEHLPDPLAFLRALKSSVIFGLIASVPNEELYPFKEENFKHDRFPHIRHYTPSEFGELLMTAGYKIQSRWCQKNKVSQVTEGTEGMFLVYVCF